jgi:lysine 6-dehydrogenase
MRMLVLGGGLQGSACAYDLLQDPEVRRVRVADLESGPLPRFLQPYEHDPRLERVTLDAHDERAVRAAMKDTDVCHNALPNAFNFDVSRIALDLGIHCCDLGGNTGIVFRQLELDGRAQERGISIVPDCGVAPGMVNILAAACIRDLDETHSVRMFVGGLPQHPEPPLNYQLVYSLAGVLEYYTVPSWILRDGKRHPVEALSEIERVEFEGIGTLEAFHTTGGLSTMARTLEGRVRDLEYKTLRYPGHADLIRAIRSLGLLDDEPIDVLGQAVVPRHLFIAAAEPRLRRPDSPDLIALRVTARGARAGAPAAITYELIDRADERLGITAMGRTTGFSLAITGLMQARGQVPAGVRTPDAAVPADGYIRELERRGIRITRSG